MTVAVVSGGVGAARFIRALSAVMDAAEIAAVINTADDTVMHGLSISPDIDSITYTLGGVTDDVRGWGMRDETWRAMEALQRFVEVRPPGSTAAPIWFNLGDQDLATHFYRTARLAEGASLTEVTDEIARAFGIAVRLLPMTDGAVRTRVTLAETGEEIAFQEYFVRLRHAEPVRSIRFERRPETGLTPQARAALADAERIVIAPSNPIVSIGPLRDLDGVDELLGSRRESVVAVSPIVGGAAIKGPADRLLVELGHEPSVVGVARIYAGIAAALVIDPVDAAHADAVRAAGMEPVIVPSIMSSPDVSARLARATLDAVPRKH